MRFAWKATLHGMGGTCFKMSGLNGRVCMTIVLQIAALGTSNASTMVQEGESVNVVEVHTSPLESQW